MRTAGAQDPLVHFATTPDGGTIAYRARGMARRAEQPPALLIRPLGGSMSLWGDFESCLLEQMPVVAFDHRGSGRSSRAPTCVTTTSLARDALIVLEHLGIERAHVFGISLGGMVATWLAILAPERVARVCLASAPAAGFSLTRLDVARALGLVACLGRPRDEVECCLVARILSSRFRREHPDEVRRFETVVRGDPSSRAGLVKLAIAAMTHDARRHLSRVGADTLVLAGEHDDVLGAQPARDLAAGVPRGRFELVAGSGHDLTLERPIVTGKRVASFFADTSRSG